MRQLKFSICILAFLAATTTCCRKDPKPLPSEITRVEPEPTSAIKGFYLVNEGNMNMNKASLDYLDLVNGIYTRNLYNQVNPEVTKGLGDVGNDIGRYGSKLYVVVNVSNKVEVLDVKTGKKIGQINITNCRYVTFNNGKAYVSAYLGKVGDPKAPNGIVAEIDTTALKVNRTVEVGRQPEEMAIIGDKLYVANSGGYSPPDYEHTVSVIDLPGFKEIKRIEVAINLHRIKADRYGDLYITSRGDYYTIPSRLFVIDTQTDQIKKVFNIAASNLAIDDDYAYIYATEWNYIEQKNTITYSMINVKDETLTDRKFIMDGTEKNIKIPYGIAVNPNSKDVYVTDAKDYVTPGKLHCYSPEGRLKWSVTTGDIPAHIAFTN
ncbi:YncE family protein [Pedobacter sp. 22226]|uniref:YncE family protein n=1 Tax=Pedobacter sp. 22226 TaxID=3453894 RepID=UPI003F84759F